MAFSDGFRVLETSTTTGSGATITLAGAETGHASFVTAVGNGNHALATILDGNGTGWMVFDATVSSGTPDTLTVGTVYHSSAGFGTQITLSANTHQVLIGPVPGIATGPVDMKDAALMAPEIKDWSETVQTPAISAGALAIDYSAGGVAAVDWNANITSLSITNPPASGKAGAVVIKLTQDATGGRTIAWPSSFKWAGGSAPTVSSAANARSRVVAMTEDGGTTWDAALVGSAFS